jgi:hypothetical protein
MQEETVRDLHNPSPAEHLGCLTTEVDSRDSANAGEGEGPVAVMKSGKTALSGIKPAVVVLSSVVQLTK